VNARYRRDSRHLRDEVKARKDSRHLRDEVKTRKDSLHLGDEVAARCRKSTAEIPQLAWVIFLPISTPTARIAAGLSAANPLR
jgi:hypothetical protein